MQDMLPGGASATVDRLPVHQHQQQQQQQQEEEGQRREGEWERHVEQEEKRRAEDEEYHQHVGKEYHAKEYHHDHYRMAAGGADEELPESPNYNQSGFQDSSQYGETSASASNSGEDFGSTITSYLSILFSNGFINISCFFRGG